MNPNDIWGNGGAGISGTAIVLNSASNTLSHAQLANGTPTPPNIWVGQGGAGTGGTGDWQG